MTDGKWGDWIKLQWNDIKGNVKYGLLLIVLGALVTGAALLTSGLPWWKDAILVFLFVLLTFWGAIATWLLRRAGIPNSVEAPDANLGKVDSIQAIAEEEPKLSDSRRKLIKRAGVLESKAGQAVWLANELERIWHVYDDEGDKLIHPLSELAVPEVVKEWRDKQLWAFRIQYRGHIGAVKANEPDFHSDIMDAPYPWKISYLDLLRKLRAHAEALREFGRSLESSVDTEADM